MSLEEPPRNSYIGIPTVRNQIQEDSRPIPSDDGQMMGQLAR
jgi:hypothetical protein